MTEAEIDRSWQLLNITADTLFKLAQEPNARADTLLKLAQRQTEPWKLVFGGMGAGAALLAAAIALVKVVL